MKQLVNIGLSKAASYVRSKRKQRKSTVNLRDYQEKCLEAIEAKLSQEVRHQLIVLPTGGGKTIIFSELIRRKRLKTLILAHRLELLEQAREKLKMVAPDIPSGVYSGERKELGHQVTIASIQSASKNAELLLKEDFELLIIDEAHHAPARSYLELIDYLGFKQLDFCRSNKASEQGIVLGFTATANRKDKKALASVFKAISYELSLEDLVGQGYLVTPKGVHVTVDIDLEDVQTVMGDYRKLSLRKVMTSDAARDIVARTIRKFASERQGIVFSVDIEHAELLKQDIKEAGFRCEAIHSKLPMTQRREALLKFENKELQFLINPMVLTEGFDSPRADCMINAAPTQNRPLYIQKSGRVLRLHPEKKDALLIDFGYVGEENPLQTAQTLGKSIEIQKVDNKLELLTEEEKVVAAKQKELEENEKLKIPLTVTHEEEYDPLGLQTVLKSDSTKKSALKKEEGSSGKEAEPSAEELLELFKFLREVGAQTFRTADTNDITPKQLGFIEILCQKVGIIPPDIHLITQISCKQGIQVIQGLKKKYHESAPTEKQLNYIAHHLRWDQERLRALNFLEAREIIAEHKENKGALMY